MLCRVSQRIMLNCPKFVTNRPKQMRHYTNNIDDVKFFPNITDPSMENIAYVGNSLDEIMATRDLLEEASKEEITKIWEEYHKEKYCVAAVIEPEQYLNLQKRWEKYPLFLLPCPKGKGAEFYVFQFVNNLAVFLKLQLYQAYQAQDHVANTPRALQVMHYCEFMESKRIVLMRGQIDPTQIDVKEAQLLIAQSQLFYLDDKRYHLVKQFNETPNTFDYNDLMNI